MNELDKVRLAGERWQAVNDDREEIYGEFVAAVIEALEAGITQAAVARAADVTPGRISQILNGRR